MRTAHPHHKEFMARYIDFCRKGTFEQEQEHHDSWLMGKLVERMEGEGKITSYNLSPYAKRGGHPWLESPLAQFADHMKGKLRKEAGHSFAKDMHGARLEPYWREIQRGQA